MLAAYSLPSKGRLTWSPSTRTGKETPEVTPASGALSHSAQANDEEPSRPSSRTVQVPGPLSNLPGKSEASRSSSTWTAAVPRSGNTYSGSEQPASSTTAMASQAANRRVTHRSSHVPWLGRFPETAPRTCGRVRMERQCLPLAAWRQVGRTCSGSGLRVDRDSPWWLTSPLSPVGMPAVTLMFTCRTTRSVSVASPLTMTTTPTSSCRSGSRPLPSSRSGSRAGGGRAGSARRRRGSRLGGSQAVRWESSRRLFPRFSFPRPSFPRPSSRRPYPHLGAKRAGRSGRRRRNSTGRRSR